MAATNLRHIEAIIEELREGDLITDLFRRALEAALGAIMESEVEELTGAEYGQRSEERRTQRNGYRKRRFDTGLGTSLLQIPKLRQGSYLPSFLTAYKRSDDALVLAVAECFRQGVSTRKVEAVARALGVESLSKSTASKMSTALDAQVEAFRKRPLPVAPYVYVDARYEFVRANSRTVKMAVLIALGVREDGGREVLGFDVAPVENAPFWGDFLRVLKKRGLRGVRLLISDAHEGLRKAIGEVFPEARWQRCKTHFLRNLGGRIVQKKRPALLSLAKTIFEQDTPDEARRQRRLVAELYREAGFGQAADLLESAEEVLTYLEFPREHWTKLHSTNVLERLNRELKRRTRVVSIFPNQASLERLTGALLLEEHEEWMVARRFISERSMRLLKSPEVQLQEMAPLTAGLLVASPEAVSQSRAGELRS